jgi:hypothetical protein
MGVLALAAMAVLALAVPAQAKGEATAVAITNGHAGSGAGGGGGFGGGGGVNSGGVNSGGVNSGGVNGGGGGSGQATGIGSGGATTVLSVPILIAGPSVTTWMEDTGVLQGVRQQHPGANELGPVLDVTLRYDCGPQHGTISQRLFPYAKGGAIIQTPPGQAFCDSMNLAPVWWHLNASTLGMLRAHGLPATPPKAGRAAGAGGAVGAQSAATGGTRPVEAGSAAHEVGGVGTPAPSSSARLPVLPIAIMAIALATVLILAFVQRRRRAGAA